MEHLGRKHGLVPADEKLLTDCDMMREEAVDMFFTIATYLYFPEHRSKVIHLQKRNPLQVVPRLSPDLEVKVLYGIQKKV